MAIAGRALHGGSTGAATSGTPQGIVVNEFQMISVSICSHKGLWSVVRAATRGLRWSHNQPMSPCIPARKRRCQHGIARRRRTFHGRDKHFAVRVNLALFRWKSASHAEGSQNEDARGEVAGYERFPMRVAGGISRLRRLLPWAPWCPRRPCCLADAVRRVRRPRGPRATSGATGAAAAGACVRAPTIP